MQYLYDKQHYIDRYDVTTIRECLDWFNELSNKFNKNQDKIQISKKEFKRQSNIAVGITVNVIAGERAKIKEETIAEWIRRDEALQNKYDQTNPPQYVICSKCKSSLTLKLISKDLGYGETDTPKILFMFECIKCKKGNAFWENGTKWQYSAPKCPKCDSELKVDQTYIKQRTITKESCPKCNYKNEDISDHKKFLVEHKLKEKIDKELLSKYRSVFVFSEQQKYEYMRSSEGVKRLLENRKEQEVKDADPSYQKAKSSKKLSVVELEKLLSKVLSKNDYVKLKFADPELDKSVIVPFRVQDSKPNRQKYDSERDLRRLLNTTLEDTNWRLMTEGVTNRLGYVSGRLRGYESVDEIYKSIKKG